MNDGTFVEGLHVIQMSDMAVKMLKKEYIALKRYFLWFFCVFYYPMTSSFKIQYIIVIIKK